MIDVHVLMPTSLPVHESRGASSRLVRDDDMSGSVHGASSSGAISRSVTIRSVYTVRPVQDQ